MCHKELHLNMSPRTYFSKETWRKSLYCVDCVALFFCVDRSFWVKFWLSGQMFMDRIRKLNRELALLAIRLPNCAFFKSFLSFVDRQAAMATDSKDGLHLSSPLGSAILKWKIRSCLNNYKGVNSAIPSLKQFASHKNNCKSGVVLYTIRPIFKHVQQSILCQWWTVPLYGTILCGNKGTLFWEIWSRTAPISNFESNRNETFS